MKLIQEFDFKNPGIKAKYLWILYPQVKGAGFKVGFLIFLKKKSGLT